MITALIVIGCVLLLAALVLAFMPNVWASVAALAALGCVMLGLDGWGPSWPVLLFWAVATLIVLGIAYLSARDPRQGRTANAYINGGALAGALVGAVLTTSAAVIIGAVAGAFCGAFAFSRTPGGRGAAPTQFLGLFVARGLPAVVVMSMVALSFGFLLLAAN